MTYDPKKCLRAQYKTVSGRRLRPGVSCMLSGPYVDACTYCRPFHPARPYDDPGPHEDDDRSPVPPLPRPTLVHLAGVRMDQTLRESLSRMLGRLEAVEARLASLEARLDGTLTTLEGTLGRVEGRLDAIVSGPPGRAPEAKRVRWVGPFLRTESPVPPRTPAGGKKRRHRAKGPSTRG